MNAASLNQNASHYPSPSLYLSPVTLKFSQEVTLASPPHPSSTLDYFLIMPSSFFFKQLSLSRLCDVSLCQEVQELHVRVYVLFLAVSWFSSGH